MAIIDEYLSNIQSATYGEEVRQSIHDAIEAINDDAGTLAQERVDLAVESALSEVDAELSNLKSAVDTLNEGGLVLKDDVIAENVQDWLDDHPEATTTVQDGSITPSKFATNAISVNTWSGSSSINNWSGETLEERLCDFLENATDGAKLDLQGAKITITERFVKSNYTFLNNTVISNGIFEIPARIGGWLSIGSPGGYRVPIFNNCVFTGDGSIFYDQSYNFKAIGCIFYDVQILNGDYIQACELVGCNIMNRNNYLIECNSAFGVTITECTFEAGNVGVFKGNGSAERSSLTYGSFINCVMEGFTDAVLKTNGIATVNFKSCYIEKVPYLIYDVKDYRDEFFVCIDGGFIDNRASSNIYTIWSNASFPTLNVTNLVFKTNGIVYLSNLTNYRHLVTASNSGEAYLFGANNGKNELFKSNHTFNGTTFEFSTNGVALPTQPQAFLIIEVGYSTTPVVFTRVSLLTLNYRLSTGYTVTNTTIVSNTNMGNDITWTASSDSVLGLVTIRGTADTNRYLSVVNLGATINGMIS